MHLLPMPIKDADIVAWRILVADMFEKQGYYDYNNAITEAAMIIERLLKERNDLENTMSKFIVSKTLLGGEPDCNKRTISKIEDDTPLVHVNPYMKEWTKEHQVALDGALAALIRFSRNIQGVKDEY